MDINYLPLDCISYMIIFMTVSAKISFLMTKYDNYILTRKLLNKEFPEMLCNHKLNMKMYFTILLSIEYWQIFNRFQPISYIKTNAGIKWVETTIFFALASKYNIFIISENVKKFILLLKNYSLYNDEPKVSKFLIYNTEYPTHVKYCYDNNRNLIHQKKIIVAEYNLYIYFAKNYPCFFTKNTKLILNDFQNIAHLNHKNMDNFPKNIIYINSNVPRNEENNALILSRKYYQS